MTTRRDFIAQAGIAAVGLSATPAMAKPTKSAFKSNRPSVDERNFTSKAVEKTIKRLKKKIADPEIAWMFENCFPNTIDTTVTYSEQNGKPDTFVITGDINAMWLRDSTAQVWPYLPLVNDDKELCLMVEGLINRQCECVQIDPYANAFNDGAGESHWMSDHTDMKPELHERKWEIDSLCYTIRLAYYYWKTTGRTTPFDANWKSMAQTIVTTFKEQQRKHNAGPYSFTRTTDRQTDTMPGFGWGNPVKANGLICSAFRPSDDATTYLYLIPSNYFAVVSLQQLAEISNKIYNDSAFAKECSDLASEVQSALNKHAEVEHLDYGKVIPFEVDGFGNDLFMDDSNIPSLLSLPYLGALDKEDPLYKRTRKFILSEDNPYFWRGKVMEGIGGPHAGVYYIWPMSIIMRALTSSDKDEIRQAITMLKNSHAGTGFMHEGVHKDNPEKFSRSWFAWVNTLFGEMILKIEREHPELLKEMY